MKLAEDKLDVYVKKQEEARIADALDRQKFANVSLIETPVRPYLPTKPNVPLNLALGFVVACFASLGTGFALEMNRKTLDSEEELESALALPVLAALGGMAVPVAIYLAINSGGDAAHGWGVAMSTDTAFALGMLALVARDDRKALRIAALAGAAVDASDAITFGVAAKDPVARRAGVLGVVSGSAAALTGAWAWRQLGGGN